MKDSKVSFQIAKSYHLEAFQGYAPQSLGLNVHIRTRVDTSSISIGTKYVLVSSCSSCFTLLSHQHPFSGVDLLRETTSMPRRQAMQMSAGHKDLLDPRRTPRQGDPQQRRRYKPLFR